VKEGSGGKKKPNTSQKANPDEGVLPAIDFVFNHTGGQGGGKEAGPNCRKNNYGSWGRKTGVKMGKRRNDEGRNTTNPGFTPYHTKG